MPHSLLIVESPAKCDKIEKYLGPAYKCLASFGHLRQLPNLKNIDLNANFSPTFEIISSKNKQIAVLQKAISNATEVILATDDDREGEAIAWHICELFHLSIKNTKRILFNEITETAIKNAVKNPARINMDLVQAQQARQILDILVGFKISPILWQNVASNPKNPLSAGRCQSPALRLVYDNYKEIQEHPGKKAYNTTGYFTSKNLPFVLNHNYACYDGNNDENNNDRGEELMTEFLEKSKSFQHNLSVESERKSTKKPPTPLTTSGLQQVANNELHTSPKETMLICQKLYEAGYITYMRTDSKSYSKEFLASAGKYIENTFGKEFINQDLEFSLERKDEKKKDEDTKDTKERKDTKKEGKHKEKAKPLAQEAHEAIRPTDINRIDLPEEFAGKQVRMYKLIWNITTESCMAPAEFKGITASVNAPEEHQYRYSCETPIFLGWKIVRGYKEEDRFAYIKSLKVGEIKVKKITSLLSIKDLKTHFTEAKLVQVLEEKGIGRPSTFSALIDKIQERNYVKKENVNGRKIECVDLELEIVKERNSTGKSGEKMKIKRNVTSREFGNEKNKLVIQSNRNLCY